MKKLRQELGERVFQAKDRTFERTQGCWNCSNSCSATDFWTKKRQDDLAIAVRLANESPLGENDPKVKNIRHMIDTVDHSVAAGALMRCTKGRQPNGDPVGDLVAHNYLCDRWSAAQGASMARAGQAADKLPEELAEDLDGKMASFDKIEIDPFKDN